jgi:hypothetical protein
MEEFSLEILVLSAMILYMGTAVFFWAIFKENRSACNNSFLGKNNIKKSLGRSTYPPNASFKEYLRTTWKPLVLSGLMISGFFVFFITHACDYT